LNLSRLFWHPAEKLILYRDGGTFKAVRFSGNICQSELVIEAGLQFTFTDTDDMDYFDAVFHSGSLFYYVNDGAGARKIKKWTPGTGTTAVPPVDWYTLTEEITSLASMKNRGILFTYVNEVGFHVVDPDTSETLKECGYNLGNTNCLATADTIKVL
jgi:hypothetical protein